jgi:hypothetical protein
MPFVDVPIPKGSLPGQRPGEGQGRLINTYCEMDAGVPSWRAAPGFSEFIDTMLDNCRGFAVVSSILYVCQNTSVLTVTSNGVLTLLTGSVSGTGPVTWAQNNKSPLPDLVLCDGSNTYTVTPSAVTSFADPDWPSMRCVTALDGFIIGLTGGAQLWATDLNDITVDPLSFTQCQANPDGGTRVIRYGRQVFVFGEASCEVYDNQGLTPFPLQRSEVISVGLLSTFSIAGYESGWDGPFIFVAADGTVRRMDGYTPTRISTRDVDRAVQSVVNKEEIVGRVEVVAGLPVFSLSSASWTWDYNPVTGFWAERQSYGLTRGRASQSVYFAGSWIVGDTQSSKLYRLTEAEYTEGDDPIVMVVESGPIKQFPERVLVKSVFFDFTTGQGDPLGNDDEANPKVSVQWSIDGGATWSNEITAQSLGSQGQFNRRIRVNVNRVTTQHGMRFRLTTSSPVYRVLRGGRASVEARNPA